MATSEARIIKPLTERADIPSNYARLIARELGLKKREMHTLLVQTGLTAEQFMQEETMLSAHQQIQILHNAIRLSRDTNFGLRLGRRLTPFTHGAMGFLANSSPDLYTALQAIRTFLPTRINFATLHLVERGDWLDCSVSFNLPMNPAVHRCLSESFAVMFFDTAEFIIDRPIEGTTTCFPHAKLDDYERYAEFIPGKIQFTAASLRTTVPMELCREPNVSANHENYLLALQQCETLLAELGSDKTSHRYRVEKMMLSQPPGTLDENDAAAALFMSKRTLARRLQAEGTSFREIRDTLLSQQAANYLQDHALSIDSIAALLNYHDSANFRRAFKRWFNVTPSEYRHNPAKHRINNAQ